MPGSIHVSVLEFKELPPSSSSVKFSLGKVEHEAREKGTFSFPLTNLRDNLIITIQDAEGNQVSHSGVRTMLIIEKGTWDDVFPIEGGGLVHMKLEFVLSDEERNRIRLMRESAMKKKEAEILTSRLRNAESAQIHASSFRRHEILTDRKDETSSSPMTEGIDSPTASANKNEAAEPNTSGNLAEKISEQNLEYKSPSESTSTPLLQETQVSSNKNNEILLQQAEVPGISLEGDQVATVEDTDTLNLMKKNNSAKSKLLDIPLEKLDKQNLEEKIPSMDQKMSKESKHSPFLQETAVKTITSGENRSQQADVSTSFHGSSSHDVGSSKSNIAEKIKSFSPKLTDEPDKQGSSEKTPRNIKKMISVFESSMSQDRVPLKPLGTKPYRAGTLRSLKDSVIKDYNEKSESGHKNSETSSRTRLRTSFSTGDLRKNLSSIITKGEQDASNNSFVEPSETNMQFNENDPEGSEKLPKDSVTATAKNVTVNNEEKIAFMGTNTNSVQKSHEEDAATSGRISPGDFKNFTEKDSWHGRTTTKDNLEYFDHDGSSPWIFLDEKRLLCMTALGDTAMRLLGDRKIGEIGHQEKIVASKSEVVVKGEVHRGSADILKQGDEMVRISENSSPTIEDEEAYNGSLGQAIKIALVVGFGVLVLLFRQREPGKGKKKENTHVFKNRVLMNKRGSLEEQRRKIGALKLS